MRVTYLSDSEIPSRWANTIHALSMSTAVAKEGHAVWLIGLLGKTRVRQVRKTLEADFQLSNDLRLALLPFLRARFMKPAYGFVAGLVAYLFRPDIVLSRNIVGALITTLLRTPTVLELHDLTFLESRYKEKSLRLLFSSGSLKLVVCITHALRDEMAGRYPEISAKLVVLPDGANSVAAKISSRSGPDQRPSIGYVGHLYPGKGADLVPILAQMRPEYAFHIYGGTTEDIKRFESLYGGIPNLYLHGWFPHSQSEYAICSLDIALLPNEERVFPGGGKTDIGRWTSPLKLFEYMAAGRTIVSSDVPVLREVLEHQRNAFLCAPMDHAQWAQALDYLVENPLHASELGATALADFEQKYSWRRRAQKLLEFLKERDAVDLSDGS